MGFISDIALGSSEELAPKKKRGFIADIALGAAEAPVAPSIDESMYPPDSQYAKTNRQRKAMQDAYNQGQGIEGIRAAHAGEMTRNSAEQAKKMSEASGVPVEGETFTGRQLGLRNLEPQADNQSTEISPIGGGALGAARGLPLVNTFVPPTPLETAPAPTYGIAGLKGDVAVGAAQLAGPLAAEASELMTGTKLIGGAVKGIKGMSLAIGGLNAAQSLRQNARDKRIAELQQTGEDPGIIGGLKQIDAPALGAATVAGVAGGAMAGYGIKMANNLGGAVSNQILNSAPARKAVESVTKEGIGEIAKRKAIEAANSNVSGPVIRNIAKAIGADVVGGTVTQSAEMLARGQNPIENPGQLAAGALIQGAASGAGQIASAKGSIGAGRDFATNQLRSNMDTARRTAVVDAAVDMDGNPIPMRKDFVPPTEAQSPEGKVIPSTETGAGGPPPSVPNPRIATAQAELDALLQRPYLNAKAHSRAEILRSIINGGNPKVVAARQAAAQADAAAIIARQAAVDEGIDPEFAQQIDGMADTSMQRPLSDRSSASNVADKEEYSPRFVQPEGNEQVRDMAEEAPTVQEFGNDAPMNGPEDSRVAAIRKVQAERLAKKNEVPVPVKEDVPVAKDPVVSESPIPMRENPIPKDALPPVLEQAANAPIARGSKIVDISGTDAQRSGVTRKGVGKKPFSPTQRDFVLNKLDEANGIFEGRPATAEDVPVRFSVPDDGEITVRNPEQVKSLREVIAKNSATREGNYRGGPREDFSDRVPKLNEDGSERAVREGPDILKISGPPEFVAKFADRTQRDAPIPMRDTPPVEATKQALPPWWISADPNVPGARLEQVYKSVKQGSGAKIQPAGFASKADWVRVNGLGDWPFFVNRDGTLTEAMTGNSIGKSRAEFEQDVAKMPWKMARMFREDIASGKRGPLSPYATPERIKAALDSLPKTDSPTPKPTKNGGGIKMRNDRGFALNPFAPNPKRPMNAAQVDAEFDRLFAPKGPAKSGIPMRDTTTQAPEPTLDATSNSPKVDMNTRVRASDFVWPERSTALPDDTGKLVQSMNPKRMPLTPEQVGEFRQWADANKKSIEAKAKRTTHAEITIGAESVVVDEKFIRDAFAGKRALTSAEDLALGSHLPSIHEATAIREAQYRAALESGVGVAEAAAAKRKQQSLDGRATIAYYMSGRQKGQDLNARKIMRQSWTLDPKSGLSVPDSYMNEAMKRLYNMTKGQSPENIGLAIDRMAMFDPDDAVSMYRFLTQLQQSPKWDASKINLYFVSNLLTGLWTHVVNLTSNTSNIARRTALTGLDAAGARLAGDYSRSPLGETGQLLKGYKSGLAKGVVQAAQIMKRGYSDDMIAALDLPPIEFNVPFTKGMDSADVIRGINPLNTTMRALRASDVVGKTMIFEGELSRQALMKARSEPTWKTASAAQREKMVAFNREMPTMEMLEAARKAALDGVYQGDYKDSSLGGYMSAFEQMISTEIPRGPLKGFQPAKIFVPFTKTLYQILRQNAHSHPLGLIRLLGGPELKARSGGTSRILAESLVMGSALTAAGYFLRENDMMEFSPPRDAGARADFYGAKKKPNSIAGIRMAYFGPVMFPLITGGLIHDFVNKNGSPNSEKEFAKRVAEASGSMFDQTFLTQPNQIMKAMSEGDWSQFGTNVASGFVPMSSFQRQTYGLLDDRVREAENFKERVQRGTYAQGNLPMRLDRFGGEIHRGGEPDPVDVEIDRLDMRLTSPKQGFSREGFQPEDIPMTLLRDRLRTMQPAKEAIRNVMKGKGWESMPDYAKAKVIREIYDNFRSQGAKRAGGAFQSGRPMSKDAEYQGEKKYQRIPLR